MVIKNGLRLGIAPIEIARGIRIEEEVVVDERVGHGPSILSRPTPAAVDSAPSYNRSHSPLVTVVRRRRSA